MKLSFTAPFILSILAATSTVSGAVLEKRLAATTTVSGTILEKRQAVSTKPVINSSISTGTPKPLQPGTRSDCRRYHLVAQGQTCAAIASAYGISQAQFISWNSGSGASCSTVWAGYYVCVGL